MTAPEPTTEPAVAILARLGPIEQAVWLEAGRRMVSGDLTAATVSDWCAAELARRTGEDAS